MLLADAYVISYYDGDSEVRCLSNFAVTPFELDGVKYHTVEAFWQSLKFEDGPKREWVQSLSSGLDAKQAGKFAPKTQLFTYQDQLYRVGSEAHHILLERALRQKTAANPEVQEALRSTGTIPFLHMLKNKYGQWRPGDSPSLPAITFETMWTRIRKELHQNQFHPELPLPPGITESL